MAELIFEVDVEVTKEDILQVTVEEQEDLTLTVEGWEE